MPIDVDTFLTTLYCIVDDVYRAQFAPCKPVRRGAKPAMTDSEVLTVALLGQWNTHNSERWMGAYVAHHWRGYFPRCLRQSAFNTRVRDVAGVLLRLGPVIQQQLAVALGVTTADEVLDGVAVPLARWCRGRRHRVFAAEAALGRGGADQAFYYGVKVLAAVDAHGPITKPVIRP